MLYINFRIGGDNIVNEYILAIQGGEIFRIYAPNEKVAINTFKKACQKYRNTDNKDYEEHWVKLNKLIDGNKYTIIKNDDFIGIRKI